MTETTTTIGVVAHYNLLERLEPAGPGDLYRARDTQHGRTVIVRLLPPRAAGESDPLLQQAVSLAGLSHPNAITLFGSGIHDDRIYLAFERITGRSLRAELGGRPMNARRAVELAIQIADAVAEAHALGFLHGGLSPEAIGITAKGHAKIATLQLGTTIGFEEPQAQGRLVDYRSPEEAAGAAGDERSDVYSTGAVLYEMLTARRPMPRGASAPSAANATVPVTLDAVALRAIAPNPDRRFQAAAELASALRAVLPGLELPDLAADVAAADAGARSGQIAILTLLVLAGLAGITWWVLHQ